MIDNDSSPVEPLAVGLAPLGSGHRAMDERPSRGAPIRIGEMSNDAKDTIPKDHTTVLT